MKHALSLTSAASDLISQTAFHALIQVIKSSGELADNTYLSFSARKQEQQCIDNGTEVLQNAI